MEKYSAPNDDEFRKFLATLPKAKEKDWQGSSLYLYQGFWVPSIFLKPIISFQNHFQAHENDIILASTPRSGMSMLKSLVYAIANRDKTLKESPLLSAGPHDLIPSIEVDLYMFNKIPNLEDRPIPRMFATFIPYPSLPSCVNDTKTSTCKIVYVCRNPLDMIISYWHFALEIRRENVEPLPIEAAFEQFCQGVYNMGPFWDHVLGYWRASLEKPNNVLFLKYEDLKENIVVYTKKVAEFLGYPISMEEEKQGIVEEITKLCSFENMKDLEVYKDGKTYGIPNKVFFRKGEVGDWVNYLSPSMGERLEKLMQEKLGDSGLTFKRPGLIK